MINLTRGVPDPSVFPINDLLHAANLVLQNDGKRVLQYLASPGYPPLIEFLAQKHGIEPNQILTGNSSLELLHYLTISEVKPGERLFAESPSYDRANLLLKRCGAEVVGIPLMTDGVDLEAFEAELKKGAPKFFYTIADFQNPMGTTASAEKRAQIAKWAVEYNFYIIEDSPYRELRYCGTPVPTIRSFAPDHVITFSSFSKTLAPGMRMGYIYGPADLIKRVTKFVGDSYIGPVSVTQGMVYEYIKAGLFEPNMTKICDLYRPRLEACLSALDECLPGAVYPRPEGGFFIGVTLPEGNSMEKLMPAAKEAGINLTDGRGFYLNPADGERFLRIPFCGLTPDEIKDAISQLTPLIVK